MRRASTWLDLLGVTGLSVAAGYELDWAAGVAVASCAMLLASWRASS